MKKIFAMLLALVMVLSLVPMTAMAAEDGTVTKEDELIAAAEVGGEYNVGYIELHDTLVVPAGKTLVLNMGGNSLWAKYRYNDYDFADYPAIRVRGTLVLNGSPCATVANGAIGIVVENGGHLTVDGVAIGGPWGRGNKDNGVVVQAGGTFVMKEGTYVCNNEGSGSGACGVYVEGLFIMEGGEISNNTYGAGVIVSGGTFRMKDGTISDHYTNLSYSVSGTTQSGGVRVENNGSFVMNGGLITRNAAGQSGSGWADLVEAGGVIVSSGSATLNGGEIKDNYSGARVVYPADRNNSYNPDFKRDIEDSDGSSLGDIFVGSENGIVSLGEGVVATGSDGNEISGKIPTGTVVTNVKDTTVKKIVASGYCGKAPLESLTWTLYNDGTLKIEGNGEMAGYQYDNTAKRVIAPWADYIGMITTVDIGEGVTSVGENAFSSEDLTVSLTTVKLPSTLIKIDNAAFNRCNYITNMTLPENLTTINRHAFFGAAISSLTIPASVTTIGYAAFADCKNLTKVVVPETVTSLSGAFWWCSGLTSLTLPSNMTSIPSSLVQGCTSLKSITIPSGVTSIGENAFKECTKLTSITIPSGVTTLGPQAFYQCTSLGTLVIPNSVTTIQSQALYGVKKVSVSSKAVYDLVRNTGYSAYNIICNASALTKTAAKDPTCTAQGNLDYWTCPICDGIFKSDSHGTKYGLTDVTLAATGHNYNDSGICTKCGATNEIAQYIKYMGPAGITVAWAKEGETELHEVEITEDSKTSEMIIAEIVGAPGSFTDLILFVKRTANSGYKPLQARTKHVRLDYYIGYPESSRAPDGGNINWDNPIDWSSLDSKWNNLRAKARDAGYEILKSENTGESRYQNGRTVRLTLDPEVCSHAGQTTENHGASCLTDAYTEYHCDTCGKVEKVYKPGTAIGYHTWVHDDSKAKATGFKCGICGVQGAAILIEYQGPSDIDLAYAYNGQLVKIATPAEAESTWKTAATIVAEVGQLQNMALFVKRAAGSKYLPLERGEGGNMWEYYTYVNDAGSEVWQNKGQWERKINATDESGASAFETVRAAAESQGYELWKVENTGDATYQYGRIVGVEVRPTTCTHSNWGAVTGDTATCQAPGTGTQTCQDCGYVKSVATEQKSHTVVIDAAKDATCSASGLTEGSHCSVCGEVLVAQTVIEQLAHTVETRKAKAATCTEAGYTGDVVCTVCGETVMEGSVISPAGHALVDIPAVVATCTHDGMLTYKTCGVCGKNFDGEGHEVVLSTLVDGAVGHQAGPVRGDYPATCTEAGFTGDTYCANCGVRIMAGKAIAPIAHNEVSADNKVEAGCETAGHEADTICADCGALIQAGAVIPAGQGHAWDNGVVNASRTERTYTCEICGATKTVALERYTETIVITKPVPTEPAEEIEDEDTPLAGLPVMFLDVSASDWFAAAVARVYAEKLMYGIEDGTRFDPYGPLTRAMAITTIYRLAGSPEAEGENPFPDVPEDRWYTDAVIWGTKVGVIEGYDNGDYGPNDLVTREQAALMMMRYAKLIGEDVDVSDFELALVEGDAVSEWALTAVRWAVKKEMLTADAEGKFNGPADATRAEMAAILVGYIDLEDESVAL